MIIRVLQFGREWKELAKTMLTIKSALIKFWKRIYTSKPKMQDLQKRIKQCINPIMHLIRIRMLCKKSIQVHLINNSILPSGRKI